MDKIKIYKESIYRKHPYRGYYYSHTEYTVNDRVIKSYEITNKGYAKGFKGVCQYIGCDFSNIEKVIFKNKYLNF